MKSQDERNKGKGKRVKGSKLYLSWGGGGDKRLSVDKEETDIAHWKMAIDKGKRESQC